MAGGRTVRTRGLLVFAEIALAVVLLFDRNDAMKIVGHVRQRNPASQPVPECYMPYRCLIPRGSTVYKHGAG